MKSVTCRAQAGSTESLKWNNTAFMAVLYRMHPNKLISHIKLVFKYNSMACT